MRLHFLLHTAWGKMLRKSVHVAYSWGTACPLVSDAAVNLHVIW